MPIFDQGYQHWSGKLSGHAWRWLAIARQGVRIGLTNRILRLLLLLSWLPAILLAGLLCLWGLLERKSDLAAPFLPLLRSLDPSILADARQYRVEVWTLGYSYFLSAELRFAMLLILLVGPNLISQDLRYNALPLYFSRPLRRIDYFLGKLGVIGAFLGLAIIVPSIVAYVLGLLFSLDLSIIPDTFGILLASIGYGLIIVVSAGLVILALSSMSRNSRYIALLWLGIWIITTAVSGILESVHQHEQAQQAWIQQQQPGQQAAALTLDDAQANWRPLVSYTANLSRVGEKLLETDRVWERLAQFQPANQRAQFLLKNSGPLYPWYWSALVLIVLFVLSVCILNLSVKSLDRLK